MPKYEGPQILSNLRATSDVEPVSRILYGIAAVTVIPLGRPLLNGSSDLPGSLARRAGTHGKWLRHRQFLPYLVLLRVGFAMPRALLRERCALTAPFHPYRNRRTSQALRACARFAFASGAKADRLSPFTQRRYIFCGTFRKVALTPPSRTLSGTLLCGVRTFLSLGRAARESRRPQPRQRPSGPTSTTHIIR